MPPVDQVVLWPSPENYPRFRDVCGDTVLPTYEEFVARAQPMVDALRADGLDVVLVDPDPDHMADWCRKNFGNITSSSRAAYAAFVALGSDAEDRAGE